MLPYTHVLNSQQSHLIVICFGQYNLKVILQINSQQPVPNYLVYHIYSNQYDLNTD